MKRFILLLFSVLVLLVLSTPVEANNGHNEAFFIDLSIDQSDVQTVDFDVGVCDSSHISINKTINSTSFETTSSKDSSNRQNALFRRARDGLICDNDIESSKKVKAKRYHRFKYHKAANFIRFKT